MCKPPLIRHLCGIGMIGFPFTGLMTETKPIKCIHWSAPLPTYTFPLNVFLSHTHQQCLLLDACPCFLSPWPRAKTNVWMRAGRKGRRALGMKSSSALNVQLKHQAKHFRNEKDSLPLLLSLLKCILFRCWNEGKMWGCVEGKDCRFCYSNGILSVVVERQTAADPTRRQEAALRKRHFRYL